MIDDLETKTELKDKFNKFIRNHKIDKINLTRIGISLEDATINKIEELHWQFGLLSKSEFMRFALHFFANQYNLNQK